MASRLTLGPMLYNWPALELRDFYFRIADEAPIDAVCLGEVVCSRRSSFFAPHLDEVTKRLEAGGKQVVISSLALIMTDGEMDEVRALGGETGRLVEANDIAALSVLAGRPHAVGPFVNVYNEDTLAYLAANGAVRISLPAELAGDGLKVLAEAANAEGVGIEVQVFGRLPLAISARCYHARLRGLHKDGCRFVCGEDRDGMDVDTLDGRNFLAVNGTQTLSHSVCCLLGELPALHEMGIGWFRLWPHSVDMAAVAALYRGVLDGHEEAQGAMARLGEIVDFAPFSNGFFHGVEGAKRIAAAE